jgi:hypothetical protein
VRLSSLDAKTILSRDQLEGLRQKTEVVDMPYSVGEKKQYGTCIFTT